MISVNSIALQLLRYDWRSPEATGEKQPAGADMIATANGVNKPSKPEQAGTTRDIYSVHHIDANQLKMHLFERLGKEFGIDMSEYDSLSAYGEAIRDAVELLRRAPGGYLLLPEIEKKLGLDKLGITIDTLINAILDPDSRHDDEVDEALRRETGEDVEDGRKADPLTILESIQLDETGIYGY